jgi:sugar phosphate isomerase/epimerase
VSGKRPSTLASAPGRVKSCRLKDWSPDPEKGYKVLLGKGSGAWPQILEAGETVGGVDYYLIEQEGSRFSPLETAKRCLENLRKMRGEV